MSRISSFLKSISKEPNYFIFLGGVHGVGKTTLCNQVFIPLKYHCVTASSLIRKHGQKTDHNKQVSSVVDNQVALIKQLNIEKKENKYLVLDGHYCLINEHNQFEPINIEVFRTIHPSIFLLLKDYPSKIATRMKKRDGNEWKESFIDEFQRLEEEHAQYIAHELKIPFKSFSNEEIALEQILTPNFTDIV